MSKEYIGREEVVAFLENMAASRYLIQCFENKEKFPAADVEPVRHGEWRLETDTEEPNPMFKLVVCSNCNSKANHTYPYCPHCGAKMDGGNKREVGFYREPKNYNISQRLAGRSNK